jgi:hypothetical protein
MPIGEDWNVADSNGFVCFEMKVFNGNSNSLEWAVRDAQQGIA